jgi:hypothetical protein
MAAVLTAWGASASAAPVTIDPGAYTGRYYINGVGGPYYGLQTVDLAPAMYTLDNGAELGGSNFTFNVDAAGNVGNIYPAAPANAVGSTITFNTIPVTINAGGYTGRYFLSIFGTAVELHGNSTFSLLPGLTYALDDGAEAGTSAFAFDVDAAGVVTTASSAATASGSTLTLATVAVQIDPQAFTGAYYLSTLGNATPLSGPSTVFLLPGLNYSLDDGSETALSSFLFLVDQAGQVSTSSPAASGAGNVLTLRNIAVHVADACSTDYSITGHLYQTTSIDVVLIPTLQITVATPGPVYTLVVIPDANGFSQTIDCVTVSTPPAGSPYAASVQPPIKSDGTSVFKANRGVVPVKFVLSLNGAATCQLPAATIALTRTSGASAGVVNQSDYLMPSDAGSAFRVDSCQYVYNLGTSSLGAGQYRVDISINGSIVGSARFGLN